MGELQRTRWAAVLAAIGAGVVAACYVGKVPPAMPALRAELGLGIVAGGWVVSLFNGLGVCGAILMGFACDRLGHRRATLAGLLVLAMGGVVGAFSAGFVWLLIGRILEGVGYLLIAVSGPGLLITASSVGDRRLAFGLWGTYMPTGMALAMLAAPIAMAAIGWRGLWLLLSVAALGMAVLLARLTTDLPRLGGHRDAGVLADIAATLRRPGLWWLSLTFAAYALQWLSLMVWLPSFLIEGRGSSNGMAAVLTTIIVAVNIPGNLLGGWLSHIGARRWWLISGASAAMGLASLGIFSDGLPDGLRYALCLAFSFFGGLLPAAALGGSAVHAPSPRQIGAANGIINQGSNLGQFAGPPAVAALVSASGNWHSASALLVGAALVAGFGGYAAALCEPRPSTRHPSSI